MDLSSQIDKSFEESKKLREQYEQSKTAKEAELKGQYGVDDRATNVENLRKSVYDTSKVLKSLPGDVTNRVKGRLVTQAQRNRILSNEQEPLSRQLSDLSMSRDVEQQGLNQARDIIKDTIGGLYDTYSRSAASEGERRNYLMNKLSMEQQQEQAKRQEESQKYLAALQANALQKQLDLQRELANAANQPSITPEGEITTSEGSTGLTQQLDKFGQYVAPAGSKQEDMLAKLGDILGISSTGNPAMEALKLLPSYQVPYQVNKKFGTDKLVNNLFDKFKGLF